MRSSRAIRCALLGLCLTALVALALAALDHVSAAVAVLQVGMLLSLGVGLAVDRRAARAEPPEEKDQ